MGKRLCTEDSERKRFTLMSVHETALRNRGYLKIAGVDEVGRGPLAGPVVAAACILSEGSFFFKLNDSKQLAPEEREALYAQLSQDPQVVFAIGIVSPRRIDEINILRATFEAMQIAVSKLAAKPDYVLVDGNRAPQFDCPCEPIVKGDAHSVSIAAASVLAKVVRDRMMDEEACKWPGYGFEVHKGYGTPQHLDAIARLGPCPIHRESFEPLKSRRALCL